MQEKLFQILNFIKFLKVNISILMIKHSLVLMVVYLINDFLQLDKIIIKDKDKKIEIGKTDIEQYFFPKKGMDGDRE